MIRYVQGNWKIRTYTVKSSIVFYARATRLETLDGTGMFFSYLSRLVLDHTSTGLSKILQLDFTRKKLNSNSLSPLRNLFPGFRFNYQFLLA